MEVFDYFEIVVMVVVEVLVVVVWVVVKIVDYFFVGF